MALLGNPGGRLNRRNDALGISEGTFARWTDIPRAAHGNDRNAGRVPRTKKNRLAAGQGSDGRGPPGKKGTIVDAPETLPGNRDRRQRSEFRRPDILGRCIAQHPALRHHQHHAVRLIAIVIIPVPRVVQRRQNHRRMQKQERKQQESPRKGPPPSPPACVWVHLQFVCRLVHRPTARQAILSRHTPSGPMSVHEKSGIVRPSGPPMRPPSPSGPATAESPASPPRPPPTRFPSFVRRRPRIPAPCPGATAARGPAPRYPRRPFPLVSPS